MSPWVEIWDKGRNEEEISDRALAVPKIKNGKVEKVIVVDPGLDTLILLLESTGSRPNMSFIEIFP